MRQENIKVRHLVETFVGWGYPAPVGDAREGMLLQAWPLHEGWAVSHGSAGDDTPRQYVYIPDPRMGDQDAFAEWLWANVHSLAQYPDAVPVEVAGRSLSWRYYDAMPERSFRAAAGLDYGYVDAWRLSDGTWVVEYGNNAESVWEVTDSIPESLSDYLIMEDLEPLERLIHIANLHGVEALEVAEKGPCCLMITSYYYGPRIVSELVRNDQGDPMTWASPEEARRWAEIHRPTETGAGQYARPTYTPLTSPPA